MTFIVTGLIAQTNNSTFSTAEFFSSKTDFNHQKSAEHWYLMITFASMPSGPMLQVLAAESIELLEYKGNLKFYSKMPVKTSKKVFKKPSFFSVFTGGNSKKLFQ